MVADIAGDGNRGYIASEATGHRVNLAHVDLHGGLVGGLEELVGPGAGQPHTYSNVIAIMEQYEYAQKR